MMNKLGQTLFNCSKSLFATIRSETILKINDATIIQTRNRYVRPVRIRYPAWYLQMERAKYDEQLTEKNRDFIKENVHDTFGDPAVISGLQTYDMKSPLKSTPFERGEWNIKSQRTGVLCRKIGGYPMWTKDGKFICATLLQVCDNHVVKYVPPELFEPRVKPYRAIGLKKNLGCLYVGAESADPQLFTKEYCGLFTKHGIMPKRKLGRFLITPNAVIQPGTPLYATHFKVGDYVDVTGVTISRGFQGVMKRWGFHGMPATHGCTKSHRKPGSIGRGRDKKIIKGKKMPGHMGNRTRTDRGIEILRINTKYNVLYLKTHGIPGKTGSWVYVYDTNVTHKLHNHHNRPHFPTYYPDEKKEPLPEDIYAPEVFDFTSPTIAYEVPVEPKKKK